MKIDTGMIQYAHDFTVATFAKSHKVLNSQINGTSNTIASGVIGGKDYIGMSKDSSVSYDIGIINPGEKKELEICIYIDENKKTMQAVEDEVERIRKIDLNKEYSISIEDFRLDISIRQNTVVRRKGVRLCSL